MRFLCQRRGLKHPFSLTSLPTISSTSPCRLQPIYYSCVSATIRLSKILVHIHSLAPLPTLWPRSHLASTSTSTSAGKKRKRSGGGTGATPASEHSAGPPAKKQLTVSHAGTTGSGGKARTPRFTNKEMNIALKGVQPTLREARDKRDLCRRCGLAGHK